MLNSMRPARKGRLQARNIFARDADTVITRERGSPGLD